VSLLGLQCALTDLFVSAASRERYAHDPRAFARRFDLNERDQAQLDALASSAIAAYASTLLRKRQSEAARLLPQTHAALGEEFGRAFEDWAQRTRLADGRRRYIGDALGFCRHLCSSGRLSAKGRAAADAERRSLRPRGWAFFFPQW
jgi:hypothetical protein